MASIRGRFVWEEFTTPDLAAGARFYDAIAGLKTAPAPFDPSYTTLMTGNGPMGGLFPFPPEAESSNTPPFWLSYIATDDIDETTRHAKSLGAKVMKPAADIGNGGRFAILVDPQGALFAVYASTQPYTPSKSVPLGGVTWHELVTTDFEAAFRFYAQLFGWTVANDMNMGGGTYRVFAPPGSKEQIGGMYTKAVNQPGPAWLPYLKVADAKRAVTKATALGAKILHGPAPEPGGGLIAIGIDPQGALFAVHATKQTKSLSSRTRARNRTKPSARKKMVNEKRAPKTRAAAKKQKTKPAARRKAGSKK